MLFLLRLQKAGYGEKVCYLIVFLSYLVGLFLGFGPFLTLTDSTASYVLDGFSFFEKNVAGNFVGVACLGVIYVLLTLLLSGFAYFIPGGKRGDSFFWPLTVVFALGTLAFTIIFNYYLFSYGFGSLSDGVTASVGACAILFDLILLLPWIPFFILRQRTFGSYSTQPAFGTGLDENPDGKRGDGQK